MLGPGPGRPEEAGLSMRLAELACRGKHRPCSACALATKPSGWRQVVTSPMHGPVHGRPVNSCTTEVGCS